MTGKLVASGGRHLTYLRVSITDLCNLRCRYCMPPEGVPKMKHADILSYEEILRIAKVGAGLGMAKLRLTGGEPLVRRGLVDFISELNKEGMFRDLRLTTNGIMLPLLAENLKKAGLKGLNISLDALDPDIYALMAGLSEKTGREMCRQAWSGFKKALDLGFDTKLNCVPIRGVNDRQLGSLAGLALEHPIDVRFIEHMPVGSGGLWEPERFMSAAQVMQILVREMGPLEPMVSDDPSAPARLFKPKGAPGAVGFISPLSGHFCAGCNRLRLTADGKLKPCLLTGQEIDLRGPLRAGASDEELVGLFLTAAERKPVSHQAPGLEGGQRGMSAIGG